MNEDALKLSVYFGDAHTTSDGRLTSDALLDCFEEHRLKLATLLRGVEGFGIGQRIHTTRFPDVSTDLPLLAIAVDARERIEAVLEDVDRVTERGLVTLEYARLATGDDVARAEFPPGPGKAGKLIAYCGRLERARGKPAYRAIVDLLGDHSALGATVLLGVDGLYHGRRERARLFGRNANVPLKIISVGPPEALLDSLPHLQELLPNPVVTLERIALLKHDGELLDEPPTVETADERDPEIWQTIRVYTRQTAQVDGRTLYTELTRRLREAGAAGVTTVRGEWGFSSDERPYGDKFGLSSHVPTYTVYIDHPRKVAELWPIVDEVTVEHGIVTSLLVPAYRERAGEITSGRLHLPERDVWRDGSAGVARSPATPSREVSSGRAAAASETAEERWLAALVADAEAFAHSRGQQQPLVRVTLQDGEQFFLESAEPRPSGGFVTLYPHPKRYEDMIAAVDGPSVPPRALVVPLGAISKIEFLAKVPRGTRSLVGFKGRQAPPSRRSSAEARGSQASSAVAPSPEA